MKNRFPILTLIVVLLVANLACLFSGTVTPTPRTIPVTQQAAQEFEAAFQNATLDPEKGTATIRVTETQITSYIAYELQKDPNPVIRNPQIYLENNQVVVYAQIVADPINTNGKAALTITVGDAGLPKVELVSAEFGSISLPPALVDGISRMVDRAIRENIDTSTVAYQLVSISISDSILSFSVRKK